MCIVLASTAHPGYALVVIDNRDEFILRPTSRPHWWRAEHQEILSARDLQREEKGTWLGITKNGNFAVLTNYRESDTHDAEHPVQGNRSRGGMVTAWLTAPKHEGVEHFVHRLLEGNGVKGVGGFSLLTGKLRRRKTDNGENQIEPLAIISNRCGTADDVPWVATDRDQTSGLSNTSFMDPDEWPKVALGKQKLQEAIHEASSANLPEDDFIQKLFGVLDTDTLPAPGDRSFDEFIFELRKSIFIPKIGTADPTTTADLPKADTIASADPDEAAKETAVADAMERLDEAERPAPEQPAPMSGIYGTQRQTVMLVGWDGKVTFVERALYDERGESIPRGQADLKFSFQIEGWDGEQYAHPPPASHL